MGRLWRSEAVSVLYRKLIDPRFAAVIIAVIALVLRLLPMRFKYLLGYDPYFHFTYVRYSLDRGEWVNFFTYAVGPWGMQIRHFHPLGLWMTPAYIYEFLSIFGVSLYNAFRVTPVIFGVLTVVFTYLAVLKLYGKEEAFLSAFFLAVLFGHVFRSMAGYYRGDNYMLFWYSVALFGVAMAISRRRRKWRYRRLIFYLIPAFASGLSAVFWQAYYPIFGFLLGSALLLAVGTFLLGGRTRFFVDSLALVLATAVGALVANALGGHFGYGMVGATEWLGRKLAEEFGLQFGFIKDVFLLIYIKYAVPLSLGFIALLMLLSRFKFMKDGKLRALIIAVSLLVAVWVGYRYYGMVDRLILKLFPESPIVETQRTAFHDLWEAYGIVVFLVPSFFLMFFPTELKIRDFVILGLAAVVLPMIVLWTRFLFIGSLTVAVMAGIGVVRLHRALLPKLSAKKLGAAGLSIIILLIPAVAAVQGIKNTAGVEPIVNGHWEEALTELGDDSNINDVVLAWWDEGHWVTYFAGRAPVAQGGPSRWVAQYYLGLKGDRALMNLGVDYVVVSYDTLLKFGAVLETANVSPGEYVMILMPRASSVGGMLLFSAGSYSLMVAPGEDSWDIKANVGGAVVIPAEVFVERGTSLERVPVTGNPTADVYVYINLNYGYAVLMNKEAFNTLLARLMFTDEYPENYAPVYSDGGYIKVFRFKHPNVAVTAENGSIVLRFTNATGTGLGIHGYLDNGTLVFKKWYGVKGKDAFVLPADINGSVVVRYVYVQKKTVLDRGIFRIDDVLHGTDGDR
ncbi:STT3 domain-containing protein [Thermococcus sp. 21S7]|uniref:STT3 domain-containing protein n=1 Tax=Thermococcus sp. 21S7 TaxID=1638221 RepID=UPI00143C9A9F|nr:STT3 domain-containing protein [Thermococcus sp. 21S7]NJE62121.1 oligosaccharyl transferase, STT3 subunit [Thermococcus sp. 21S7]